MNKLIILTIFLFTSLGSYGAESRFVVPSGGALKYSHSDEEKLEDYFSGTVTLTGKLMFERFPYDDIKEVVLHFLPDSSSSAKLPYKSGLGPVKTIELSGDIKKYIALLSEEQKNKLFSGVYPSIELKTTIIATDYMSEVSCDNTHYWLRIVRMIKSNEKPKPSKVFTKGGNCG